MKIKDIQKNDREYYITNKEGEMFAGIIGGQIVWTNKTAQAKPLYDLRQFSFFKRYYSFMEPKIQFL